MNCIIGMVLKVWMTTERETQTVVALVDYMLYVCLYTMCIYFVYLDTALRSLILDLTVTCIIILLNQYIYIYI